MAFSQISHSLFSLDFLPRNFTKCRLLGFPLQHGYSSNRTAPTVTTTSNRIFLPVSVSSSTSEFVVDDDDDPQLRQNGSLTSPSSSFFSAWEEFANNVSGEWDGFGANFSTDGKPIELPESVVPEAFREWEVKVFDWQTQCPTLAEPQHFVAKYKLIKLLPTVGCEADAATQYSIDERHIGGVDNKVSAMAYLSSGCYVAVWPIKNHGTYRILELEHCLVDPKNRESRVRIIQVIRAQNFKLVLQNIKVFCEQWYGPFRNGDQLGGCSIRDSAFASTAALRSSEVVGAWQGLHAFANFQNSKDGIIQELTDDCVRKSVRDENNLVLLPKQLWCSVKEGNDGNSHCDVGWLLDEGSAITSKCIFWNDTKLKEIAIACETLLTEYQTSIQQ